MGNCARSKNAWFVRGLRCLPKLWLVVCLQSVWESDNAHHELRLLLYTFKSLCDSLTVNKFHACVTSIVDVSWITVYAPQTHLFLFPMFLATAVLLFLDRGEREGHFVICDDPRHKKKETPGALSLTWTLSQGCAKLELLSFCTSSSPKPRSLSLSFALLTFHQVSSFSKTVSHIPQ